MKIAREVLVDVDLYDFSDIDLQIELESRGYFVAEYEPVLDIADFSDNDLKDELENRDMQFIQEKLEQPDLELLLDLLGDPKPGSEKYNVAEKLRYVYYHG